VKPWQAVVAGVAVALAILDAVTTHVGLRFGAVEANPGATLLLERWGAPVMFAVGVLATALLAALALAAGCLGRLGRLVAGAAMVGLAAKAWAVANNVAVLGALAP
jgi:hypothetical protein